MCKMTFYVTAEDEILSSTNEIIVMQNNVWQHLNFVKPFHVKDNDFIQTLSKFSSELYLLS